MNANLDQYGDIVFRLAAETVRCSPDTWQRGMLSIQSDGVRITYQLKSDDSADKASISEALRDLIDELYVRMSSAGDVWREAFLNWWREQNDLKFKIDFTYSEATQRTAPSVRREPKRSWRKWFG